MGLQGNAAGRRVLVSRSGGTVLKAVAVARRLLDDLWTTRTLPASCGLLLVSVDGSRSMDHLKTAI